MPSFTANGVRRRDSHNGQLAPIGPGGRQKSVAFVPRTGGLALRKYSRNSGTLFFQVAP